MIWHSSSSEQVLSELAVNVDTGLTNSEVLARSQKYGKNILNITKRSSVSKKILDLVFNPTNLLIEISALISLVVFIFYNNAKWYYPIFILLLLAINCGITIYLNRLYEDKTAKLKTLSIPHVKVKREGEVKAIFADELVPGDILCLEAGDYVGADARLIKAYDFRCDETYVTGEEIATEKIANITLDNMIELNGRCNMVYMGSNVVTGSAIAVVTETGMNTETGKNITLFKTHDSDDALLKSRFNSISKFSTVFLLISCFVIFLIGFFINIDAPGSFAVILTDTFMRSVVLLVSLLPEGLTVLSGVAASFSVMRLLKNDLIVKDVGVFNKLPTVSVICSDKTGVLTESSMVVNYVNNGKRTVPITEVAGDENAVFVLRLASLCTNQSDEDREGPMYGDPTELAIINSCKTVTNQSDDLWNHYPRLNKIPFDNQRKIMTSINLFDGKPYAIVKGAPDYILNLCNDIDKESVAKEIEGFTKSALRVIAVAFKPLESVPSNPTEEEIENNLTFCGFITLFNPPQKESITLIRQADSAGIKTIMITGDHNETARSTARRLGILKDGTFAISGDELKELSDDELKQSIAKYSVFSRVSPMDKLRIVKALQNSGETVAITGDSVNDAQSLNMADVALADGNSGTDVARGASDIIMNKVGYSAIIKAITASREMFLSLRRALTYIISSNLAELLVVFFGLLIFGRFPITVLGLLLVNLLTDSIPVFSILSDTIEYNPPLRRHTKDVKMLFTPKSVITIAVQTFVILLTSIIAYAIGKTTSVPYAETFAFGVLCLSQFFNMLSVKSKDYFFRFKGFKNKYITIALLLSFVLGILLIVSPLATALGITMLSFGDFVIVLLLSGISLLSGEAVKFGYNFYMKKYVK